MKAIKAIKKMVALGMGLTMVGATIFGASAATLADLPAPFVVNGTPASNLAIIVGDQADGSDVVGAIDITQWLQQSAKVTVNAPGAPSQLVVTGDAVEIGSPSDLLEINEVIGNVRETITEVDLDMLKGGQIVTDRGSTEFNQYLRFINNNAVDIGKAIFDQDERDRVGHYLHWDENQQLFQWELEFEEGLESDWDGSFTEAAGTWTWGLPDLEDEDITMLGQPFVIVDSRLKNATDGCQTTVDTRIDFIGGAVSAVLGENDKATYIIDGKEYEVEVMIISETSDSIKFRVNGEITDELRDGETDILADGTQLGIRDILGTGKDIQKSIVQFYLGAYKIEFHDTNSTINDPTFTQSGTKVNEETIEDSQVRIQGEFMNNCETYKLNNIRYNLTARAVLGDIYITPGSGLRENLKEPEGMLTPAWDIKYEGLMDTGVTYVRFDASGNREYNLEFTNQEGIFYKMPLLSNRNAIWRYGDRNSNMWFQEADTGPSPTGGAFPIGLRDYFIVSNCLAAPYNVAAGTDDTCFTHVFKWDSLDATNNRLTLTDLGTGSKEISFNANTGAANLIAGGVTYNIVVNVATNTDMRVDLDGDGAILGNCTLRTGRALVAVQGEGLISFSSQNTSFNATNNILNATPVDETNVTNNSCQLATMANISIVTLQKEFDEAPALAGVAFDEVVNITFTQRLVGGQNRVGILATTPIAGNAAMYFSGMIELQENEDVWQGLTGYGVFFEKYEPQTGQQAEDLTVEYPLSQRGARVFITGGVTTVTETATGGAGEVIQPIQLGAAMLASEVSNVANYNAVVVGGPCANPIAATLLGNPEPCWESVGVNKAIVKLVEQGNGNVALLVNGREAIDTRRACRALATQTFPAVSEAEVTGTTLTDITVRAIGTPTA